MATSLPMSWTLTGACMVRNQCKRRDRTVAPQICPTLPVANENGAGKIPVMKSNNDVSLPHIVVVGAGFAGLRFVQNFPVHLARITLIDRQNHHLFQPL